ncbi:MAG: PEP-CTERM sorting domain-containing protein, partial [Pirellulaceae bacterium]|nr:PEP-CTERM sorting domain-containing protein [Pirellulaceae bacterium]
AMSAGHYGVQSWAQYQGGGSSRYRGTEVESVTVTSDTFNKTHTFPGAIATNWRHLIMTDANGLMASGSDDYGNFRQAFTTGTISDDSNSYQWATTTAPNVDFVGQAVVVDEPGAVSWTDYEMTVRVSCIDDEGPGVLVRVQDDNTFYRINFATEPLAGNNGAYTYQRSPQGMSIQKCVDGGEGNPPVWTELFHDDQDDPAFLYTAGQEFDLKVTVVGNAITVSVIDDPDGTPNVIDYDPVYDDKGTPILSGSVALTNWGGGAAGLGPVFSAYGGIEGHALLTYVPEPSMLMLLGMLGVCSLAVRRRK